MNENRVTSLRKQFDGVVPNRTTLYTKEEIVDKAQKILDIMKSGIYEKVHAEYMRDKDVLLHISVLANEYGLESTETYKRFERNMQGLGYMIGTYIKGMKGEQIAKKALKLIGYDKNVKVLYNVALEDEDVQAEYDAIVLTPYETFIVEVKNWGNEVEIDVNGILRRKDQDIRYDLAGRMSIKEALLRKVLGELSPEEYRGIVLFPNDNTKVRDEFMQISTCCGGGIAYKIRKYDEGKVVFTAEQIEQIANRIISNHKVQKTFCKVNCEEIINDYALLMAAIEEASEGIYTLCEELKDSRVECEQLEQFEVNENNTVQHVSEVERKRKVKYLVGEVAGVLIAFGIGFATAKTIVTRR